jgi:acyl-coenzyme A thioesterase PaaI-like protein
VGLIAGGPEGATARPIGSDLTSWLVDGEWRHTQVQIGPEGCIEGTDRPLTGVLFAHLDVVTGSPPSGPMNPTVDLNVRLFSPPRLGTIRFTARTLRLGRTLYVGEAEMRHELEQMPFGIGIATFLNQPIPFPHLLDSASLPTGETEGPRTGYKRLTDARRVGLGIFELVANIHTPQGTVSGATLGRLAELAATDLLGGAEAVDEMDVRFLNKVKVGPLRATATVLGRRDDATTVRIEITDTGNQDRLVTYALAVCRHLRPA